MNFILQTINYYFCKYCVLCELCVLTTYMQLLPASMQDRPGRCIFPYLVDIARPIEINSHGYVHT